MPVPSSRLLGLYHSERRKRALSQEWPVDVRVSDGTAAFYWTGSRRADRLYVYAADGGKVADIRMNGGTVEIRGLKPGIYYYRLELKDTEEAVAGKLLVR